MRQLVGLANQFQVVENQPTKYEIQELKNLELLFTHLNQQTEVLKDKLENPDSDEDHELDQVTLAKSEAWSDPDDPNVINFLRNVFEMKQQRFRVDIENKDVKSTTLHELFSY